LCKWNPARGELPRIPYSWDGLGTGSARCEVKTPDPMEERVKFYNLPSGHPAMRASISKRGPQRSAPSTEQRPRCATPKPFCECRRESVASMPIPCGVGAPAALVKTVDGTLIFPRNHRRPRGGETTSRAGHGPATTPHGSTR
jgi:hypothetical protein